MTSQHSSERTARAENSARRPTVRRGLKKRGVLPSFGDMILPVVGVFAVVLLVIAGRQFFLNGMKTSPGIASTRAYAEAPAVLAELEKQSEAEPLALLNNNAPVSKEPEAEEIKTEENNNNNKDEFLAFAMPVTVPKPEAKKVTASPVQTISAKKSTTAKSSSNATVKKTSSKTQTQAKTSKNSVNPHQWRVQIGAYTNKAGAQEAANKIKKAGYNAIVYSNPASKHFKVWVQGGADKKAAENVVKAMQKLGYKGSFSFPPAK